MYINLWNSLEDKDIDFESLCLEDINTVIKIMKEGKKYLLSDRPKVDNEVVIDQEDSQYHGCVGTVDYFEFDSENDEPFRVRFPLTDGSKGVSYSFFKEASLTKV